MRAVQSQEVTPPALPNSGKTVEEILADARKVYERKAKAQAAKKWMEFKVNVDGPIGLNFFGDPHLDSPGCNIPLLEDHINALVNGKHVYNINIGDTTDNWVGRLITKYIDSNMTKAEAYVLTRWFLQEAGLHWLVILLGNHDTWNEGKLVLDQMNFDHKLIMEDWKAQFQLAFPNGRICKVDARHDHKGHSMYHELHAQKRAMLFGQLANICIAGHRHTWGLEKMEFVSRYDESFFVWLSRAKGYKDIDDYAEKLQFDTKTTGHSIFYVIDPDAERETNFVQGYDDVEEGLDILAWKQKRFEDGKTKG